jgi:molybdopterin-binding protein
VSDEHLRIQIGFDSGQTVTALISEPSFEELKAALGGDSVIEVATEDGSIVVPARAVSYVKRFSRETSIGFSG